MKVGTYVIEQRDGRWCLLTSDGSRVIGCHDSRAEAEAQERAIEAAKNSQTAYELQGVEIFKAGTWNGDTYSVEDLDAIVAAANEVGFTPPIKAGHVNDTAAPALGWVENLRRIGETLYADLVALPKLVYDAIVQRSYDTVSAEIYWDLSRNGKKFPRVLKALALLGAEVPAVDLAPLSEFFKLSASPTDPCHVYAVELALEATPSPPVPPAHTPTGGDVTPPATSPRTVSASGIGKVTLSVTPSPVTRTVSASGTGNVTLLGGAHQMATKTHAEMVDPAADGSCPDGYVKGDDGKCHMKAMSQDAPEVKSGEIVVTLAQLEDLKRKAARSERVESLERQLEEQARQSAEFVDKQRDARIAFKLRETKIPAFRPFVRVFYDLALRHAPDAKIYSIGDDKVMLTPEAVVDAWVDAVNKHAELLFSSMSIDTKANDPDEPEAVQEKISYRVNQYLRSNKLHPKKDYATALRAVLDADPELKADYIRS